MNDTPAVVRFRPRATLKGRQTEPQSRAFVARVCEDLAPRADLLIEHLHRLQDHVGALRRAHLAALAERLRLSQVEVYEVATFYHHFEVVDDDVPVAPIAVRVCTSLACAMAGGEGVLEAAREAFARTTDVRVLEAPCIGRCDSAPAACVGRHAFGGATPRALLDAVEAHATAPRIPAHAVDLARYLAAGGYALWDQCARGERAATDIVDAIDRAGLRGLGGAGFPAARKWRTVAAQPAPRAVVVNIDEGEVGTFKDRAIVEADPHRMLEGLLIAAWAVGASRCFLYLRDEYHDAHALLSRELAALRARPPFGHALPDIELRRGAGAYICGEESALIESIEGKRGMPRLRPPIVAEVGVFGLPTLAHNIETLAWVRDIVERGPAWWTSHGRAGRTGLRRFSVSGRVARPGVHLAPAGISLRALVDEYAGGMLPGHTLYAYLPGGASGGILPASLADLPLDFDTLAAHGAFVGSMAVIVLSQADRARDAAANLMRFFAEESCGQCTPCRAGTAQTLRLLAAPRWDPDLLADLSQVMRDASICGLGQAAPNPVDSVLRFFPHEVGGVV